MSPFLIEQIEKSIWQTLEMTAVSGFFSLLGGLPLALLLVTTMPNGLYPLPVFNQTLGGIINAVRSIPFIVLLIALIPLTRLIIGTSIGTGAAIVPLSIAAVPYFARIAEVSLKEVDHGVIEAAHAMGAGKFFIIRQVMIPEALPGLISGFTVTLVTLVSSSAMAGAVGGGGLGDLAIRYGYERFRIDIMLIVVVVLIIFVCLIQWIGDRLAAYTDHD
ncbi:methionine ABC transporter permease [Entomobacter blattae]|uniref:D-methionine transport system permease protein MetI n=1 Tax=Entomobacter blattae TaxID=2762277 RepID=A0A7H1NUL7_9PROT|nr:methionine ABC transporter permease [Entomobacter blattae]QNT79477.1 D-methionine transport system permease protein MetI [Entomobacter blattae]